MKSLLVIGMVALQTTMGIKVSQTNTEALDEGLDLGRRRNQMGFFVDGVVSMLEHLDESNATGITEEQFIHGAKSELEKMAKEGVEGMLEDVKNAFTHLDKDKNGELSKEELIGAFFMLVDKDGNGAVSHREMFRLIKQYARHMGLELKKGWWRKVKGAFKQMDKNDSGDITFEELVAWLDEHGAKVKDFKGAVESLSEKPAEEE